MIRKATSQHEARYIQLCVEQTAQFFGAESPRCLPGEPVPKLHPRAVSTVSYTPNRYAVVISANKKEDEHQAAGWVGKQAKHDRPEHVTRLHDSDE